MKLVAMVCLAIGFTSTAVEAVEDSSTDPPSTDPPPASRFFVHQAPEASPPRASTAQAPLPNGAPEVLAPPVPAPAATDDVGNRLLAAAIVTMPVVVAGVIAAYLVPLGLGSPIFPLIAVVLPGATAGIASLFVAPVVWFWVPMLGATAGTVVGLISGAALGLGALAVLPPDLFEGDRNFFILLPTMALFTGLGAGVGAGATTFLVAGSNDAE